MELELISFDTCPYVHRAGIALIEKKVPYKLTLIEAENRPDWFYKISPRGKVPVLKANGTPLFESAAILEFLDETTPAPHFMPQDPIERARARAWIAFVSDDVLVSTYRLLYAKTPEKLTAARETLDQALTRLNEEMKDRDYLTGDGKSFGMVDVAIAPFFHRAGFFKRKNWVDLLAKYPALQAWSERILERPSIEEAIPQTYAQSTEDSLRKYESLLLTA